MKLPDEVLAHDAGRLLRLLQIEALAKPDDEPGEFTEGGEGW